MARARAVVIGAEVGGLAAAAGLCLAGWDVTVCERSTSLEPVGAGLALGPNGLRALDVIGACQALEDAAVLARLATGTAADAVPDLLDRYTTTRLPRTSDVVRWSRRAGAMTTWASPPAVALRDTVSWLGGKLARGAALRGLTPLYDWQPPAADSAWTR